MSLSELFRCFPTFFQLLLLLFGQLLVWLRCIDLRKNTIVWPSFSHQDFIKHLIEVIGLLLRLRVAFFHILFWLCSTCLLLIEVFRMFLKEIVLGIAWKFHLLVEMCGSWNRCGDRCLCNKVVEDVWLGWNWTGRGLEGRCSCRYRLVHYQTDWSVELLDLHLPLTRYEVVNSWLHGRNHGCSLLRFSSHTVWKWALLTLLSRICRRDLCFWLETALQYLLSPVSRVRSICRLDR